LDTNSLAAFFKADEDCDAHVAAPVSSLGDLDCDDWLTWRYYCAESDYFGELRWDGASCSRGNGEVDLYAPFLVA